MMQTKRKKSIVNGYKVFILIMARYQLLCYFVVAVVGFQITSSQHPLPDTTVSSLTKEVEDNSRYKTLEANATLLKLLVDDKDGVSSSEVFDMLHSRDDNQEHIDLPTFPEDMEDVHVDVTGIPDAEAEFLQGPRGEPIGAAAGIMVVVTCSIVCLAYTSLVVWRRLYMKRNGLKHELLRNEEGIAETRIEL
ncbi:PREDICTED: uncharacterized protein LOC106116042 isoform X2 [Papilio xuthus]|uniref:Uncharacterized protein LOC106116042 isoform X2 n=1 Tax=Papilio xuthus TaxID=66420 RepID=A0AAJ7E6Q2_PAPXU|nr:PREDICTED: uncharacterized protein LOC106116042 isoform X2 [Papilio xuthus]